MGRRRCHRAIARVLGGEHFRTPRRGGQTDSVSRYAAPASRRATAQFFEMVTASCDRRAVVLGAAGTASSPAAYALPAAVLCVPVIIAMSAGPRAISEQRRRWFFSLIGVAVIAGC